MSYSLDLRERVVAATNQGMTLERAAAVFRVSPATIARWRRQARERGDLTPSAPPGRPRRIAPTQEAELTSQVQTYPDATLSEHCRRWAEQTGVVVSPATMCRAFQRLGWTVKKSASSPASRTPAGASCGGR